MSVLAVASLGVAGCEKAPTTLLLDIAVDAGDTPPPSLLVSVFDRFGPLAPRDERIKNPPPGKLVVDGLPNIKQPIRIAMRGGSGGAMRYASIVLDTSPHVQARAQVTLVASVTDTDGDNVPDVLDNCPTVPNPDQENEAGEGAGNACRESSPDLSVGDDLQIPDVDLLDPNADLLPPPPDLVPPADLFGVDAPPPDLTPVLDLKTIDLKPPPADLKPVNPSLCPVSGAIFCDGFESGTLSSGWFVAQNNASVTVSTTRAYRGSYSMKVVNNAGGQTQGRLEHASILSATTTDFYARAFIYREPGGMSYPSYFEALQGSGGTGYQAGHSTSYGSLITYAPSADVTSSTAQLQAGRWDCVEWQVHYGTGTSGYMQLWINDSASIDMTGMTIAQLDQFFVGYNGDENHASTTYIDEIVIDDQRIGCSK